MQVALPIVAPEIVTNTNAVARVGVEKIRLTNFRSYAHLRLDLDGSMRPIVLTGHNGAGKTNLLEAVSLLTPGRGMRRARLNDIARHGENVPTGENVAAMPVRWAVAATVRNAYGAVEVGTGCEASTTPDTKTNERRIVKIDGRTAKTQAELADVMSAIWLTPSMDRIFCGDSAPRRRFLDRLVSAFDTGHAARSQAYAQAFKQWVTVARSERPNHSWLAALEETIAAHGIAVAAARREMMIRLTHALNDETQTVFPRADIALKGLVENWLNDMPALAAEDAFRAHLAKMRTACANGETVTGIHTSDFAVTHRAKGMCASLCSTGEQKALLISLILAQTRAQRHATGYAPVLLLDEVAAHLDEKRRAALFDELCSINSQVWLTGTETNAFSHLEGRAQFLSLSDSAIAAFN